MRIEDEIKSKFRNEKQKALVNLQYTQLAVSNKLNEVFKAHSISLQQFNVLRILRGQLPNATSIGLIKERMLDKNSDVSRIIDRLKEKKLVSCTKCKVDKRQKDVLITDKGLALLKGLDKQEKSMDDLMGGISEKEAVLLNNILDKVREKFRQ